jgi:hypothetical protein
MTRALVIVLLVGCTRPKPTPPAPPPPDAASAEEREDCMARCDSIVMSRHDACGYRRGARSYPDWCADSNRRMYDECAIGC